MCADVMEGGMCSSSVYVTAPGGPKGRHRALQCTTVRDLRSDLKVAKCTDDLCPPNPPLANPNGACLGNTMLSILSRDVCASRGPHHRGR